MGSQQFNTAQGQVTGKVNILALIVTKKKPSPRTVARNGKMKEEFLARNRSPQPGDTEEKVMAALDTPVAKSTSDEVNEI